MNKLYMAILFLLFLPIVNAAITKPTNLLDRPLINVTNCYNLTIHYELTDGVATPVSFIGCTDKGNGDWSCNCREDDNLYTVIMRTDKSIIRDPREYDIDIDGYVYDFYEDSISFRVLDWGDYTEVKGKRLNDLGSDSADDNDNTCSDRVEVIYLNRTVEKIVEVPVETIREVRVEDTVKINVLNQKITTLSANNTALIDSLERQQNTNNTNKTIMWASIIGCLGALAYIFLYMREQ